MNTKFSSAKTIRLSLLLLAAAVCSAALFLFCYNVDNKYTVQGPQPKDGVLILSKRDLQEHPFVYLTMGWEIYRGKLLAPEDFTTGFVLPDEHVFIGQYGGFEGHVVDGAASRSPHGSATYRLNIALPPEPGSYTLELPEIYSAYRLYVNGELVAGMGDPDREGYRAETGNQKVTLRCADRMEILLAVSDYSHFYSGMVYPPAFGESATVEKILNTHFGLRFAAVALALGVGTFYFGIWLLLRKQKEQSDGKRLPLYYAALCLCFSLYICYPVVKTLWVSGTGWYTLENLAFTAMLLLVAIIQSRISGFPKRWTRIFTAMGIATCCWTVIVPFVMGDSLNLMLAYSAVLTVYSWAAALFLLASAAYGVHKGSVHSKTMLAGAVVFGMSLVMDRLLPLFEPIRFGWFSELSGAVFVLFIGIVMATEVAGQFRLRLQLEGRVESVTRMMEMQKTYYPVVLGKEEELRAARHDFRHHMATIRALMTGEQSPELTLYMESFDDRYAPKTDISYCKHFVADMQLRMYAGLAAKQDTAFSVQASLPETLPIDDVDLCVVMSNLLENALEATAKIPKEDRRIHLRIRCKMNCFGISVDNTFDGTVHMRGERFLSRKQNEREGIGLASVRSVCGMYGGSAEFYVREDNTFHSEVLMPLTGKEGEPT